MPVWVVLLMVSCCTSCNIGPPLPGCIHDRAASMGERSNVDEGACCSLCDATSGCVAWTSWTENSVKMCNLFNKKSQAEPGMCTSGGSTAPKQRPNFIVVFPDTLRAESFNSYGLKVANVTPAVAKFAASGTMFTQAHVMHTQCSPSRATMLTGRYMHVQGHRTQTHLIQDYEPNYLRALKNAGYHVMWWGKNDALSAASMNLSVTEWHQDIGYASGDNAFEFGEAGWFSFLYTGATSEGNTGGDYEGAQAAIKFLKSSPPEPFVVFLPSRGAHPPYGAPKGWHDKFSVEEVKKAVTLRPRDLANKPAYMRDSNGIPHFRNLTALSEDVFYKIQAVYLGMISYTDWLFGEVMDALDSAPGGLSDRTAVFFSSDHGDFGGDYGLVEKWPGSMDDVLTRVPLVARIPGGLKGGVSDAPVQTADIFETMLDLAGVNETWIRFASSLAPVLRGGKGDANRFVFSEGGFYFENEQMIEANECLGQCPKGLYCARGREEAQPNGSPRAVMIRNLTSKLVHRPTGVSEMYDLTKDPRELNNLFHDSSYIGLKNDLMAHLLDWMVLTSDVTPLHMDSRGSPKWPHPLPPGDPWADFDPDVDVSPSDYLAINGVV